MGDTLLILQQTGTSISAWAITREGETLARREIALPLSHISDDRLEVDAHDVSLIAGEVLDGILKHIELERFAGVSLVSQTGYTVMWERAGSRPFTPLVVRDDVRGQELSANFRRRGFDEPFRIRTGRIPVGQAAGFKLSVLLSDISKALHRAALGELCFGTVNTYLIWRLSGSKVHAIDRTDAAETMLFNLERLDWDNELLEVFNVPSACLPVVYPPAFVYTETTLGSKLPAAVPLAASVAEPQAVVFGCDVAEPGAALVYLDETVHVKAITGPERARGANRSDLTCDKEGLTQFMEPVTLVDGGNFKRWAEALGLPRTINNLEKIALSEEPDPGLFLLDDAPTESVSSVQEHRKVMLHGLRAKTTDAQIARCLFTSIAHRIRTTLDGLASPKVKKLTIDGPLAGSKLLAQSIADVTGCPVIAFSNGDSAVIGAAQLAGLTLGWDTNIDTFRSKSVIRPQSKAAQRRSAAQKWQKALASRE